MVGGLIIRCDGNHECRFPLREYDTSQPYMAYVLPAGARALASRPPISPAVARSLTSSFKHKVQ